MRYVQQEKLSWKQEEIRLMLMREPVCFLPVFVYIKIQLT